MRILLDAGVDQRLETILRIMGHDCDHIGKSDLGAISDEEVVSLAEQYNVLISLDLHRQEAEWLAVHEGLVNRGVCLMRIRTPGKSDALWEQVMSVLWKMPQWTKHVADGMALISVKNNGTTVTPTSREEAAAQLEARKGSAGQS